MSDIKKRAANCWCNRLNKLMKDNNYTQKTFLKEYKIKYGGGTQANISRWLRVGNRLENGGEIGFPSYDTMLNLADFFGVTVGYLTGETDYETFEMEKVCNFMSIDEETMKAILGITSGKSVDFFGKYNRKEYTAVFKHIVTARSFSMFIRDIREYVVNLYAQKYPNKHIDAVSYGIQPAILDLALKCIDYQFEMVNGQVVIDDFKDNDVEPTEALLNAIHDLNDAIHADYEEQYEREREIKLSEYELQKLFFEIINEMTTDENILDIMF